jgi:hypothetical protein
LAGQWREMASAQKQKQRQRKKYSFPYHPELGVNYIRNWFQLGSE